MFAEREAGARANAISVLGDDDVSERVMTYLAERTAVKLILLRGAASDNIHLPSARARGIQVWAPLPTLDADNIHLPLQVSLLLALRRESAGWRSVSYKYL